MKTLKSRSAFSEVFKLGVSVSTRHVRAKVLAAADAEAETEVAYVCAKRLGNAVVRNRSKRVLRAAVSGSALPQQGWRIILFATQHTKLAHPDAVRADLLRVVYTMDR